MCKMLGVSRLAGSEFMGVGTEGSRGVPILKRGQEYGFALPPNIWHYSGQIAPQITVYPNVPFHVLAPTGRRA